MPPRIERTSMGRMPAGRLMRRKWTGATAGPGPECDTTWRM